MSADPVPPAPRTGRGLLAVLLAAGIAALVRFLFGFEFGRDTHLIPVLAAFGAAFVCALVVVSRAPRARRALALLVSAGGATAAYWFVPGFAGAPSLAEANARCAAAIAQTDVPLFEAPERDRLVRRQLDDVREHYPRLVNRYEWSQPLEEWRKVAFRTLRQKWEALGANDFAGARDLAESERKLHFGDNKSTARTEWEARVLLDREKELDAVPPTDWAGFDRTAQARKELAALAGTEVLVEAELAWVAAAVQPSIDKGAPVGATSWADLEDKLLALDGVTRTLGDDRFAAARLAVFARAHEAAQRAATKHIGAREYDAAFALARAHAVRWNATAGIFGEKETQKLDKLRDACAVLARFAEIAGPPDEPAPPPREKP